ncbi:hypothetical protein [Streptomyces sp. NPDC048606]|uniref:hypothetical protein n=1 Tax=Streptomyces sp. NPDC048606 TaxID=3154726 RepID=UPI00343BBE7A
MNSAAPHGAFHTHVEGLLPRPVDRVDDGAIDAMRIGRTVLGMVAAVWLVMAYPLSDGRQEFVLGKVVELGIACAVLLLGSVIGIAAFLAASTRDRRRELAGRLTGPVVSVLALALGPTVIWGTAKTLKGELVEGADLMDFFSGIVGRGVLCSLLSFLVLAIGWLLALILLLAAIPYTLVVAYICVVSCFRASDVHQLLPALLSPLLVWSLFAFQLFDGPDVAAPPLVLYTFLLGGPLSVTALSVWEVRRLRARHGITLRTALGR